MPKPKHKQAKASKNNKKQANNKNKKLKLTRTKPNTNKQKQTKTKTTATNKPYDSAINSVPPFRSAQKPAEGGKAQAPLLRCPLRPHHLSLLLHILGIID